MKKYKSLSIYPDKENLYKMHFVARYEARSVNKHVLRLVYDDIRRFEKEHGPIIMPPEPDGE